DQPTGSAAGLSRRQRNRTSYRKWQGSYQISGRRHERKRVAATTTTPVITTRGSAGASTAADTRTRAPQTAPRPRATTIAARRRASGPIAPSALSSLRSAVSVPVTYVVDSAGARVRAVTA